MRLEKGELEGIKRAFQETFLPNDHLWLFGSRVDDAKRGGDIDLYIETSEDDPDVVYNKRRRFLVTLFDYIDEQRVDVVVKRPSKHLPIHDEAKETGVLLI
jgi:predicted nucleotidyltransferase